MSWDDDEDDKPVALPLVADQPAGGRGAITDAFANPWVSIPYALANAFAAAASPGTARASQALNAGLGMGMASEKNAYENLRRKKLSEAMGKLAQSTTPVTTKVAQASPATVALSRPDDETDADNEQRMSDLEPVTRVDERPNFSKRQQDYLSTVAQENPSAAMSLIGQSLFREPKEVRPPPAPVHFNSGRERIGSYYDPESGRWTTTTVPMTPEEPKAATWRPFTRDLGDAIESGLVSSTGETKDVKRESKGAPPARPKTPEEIEKLKADTELSRARTGQARAAAERAQRAIAVAKDPKVTIEKLTTELSVAIRDQKNARDAGDDEGLENATIVVNELRKSLARRAIERNQGPSMETLPPAKAHKGKIVRDTQTGARMQSDGTSWVPIDGPSTY